MHKKHPLGKYFVLLIVVVSLFALYSVWKDEITALTGKVAYGIGLTDGALDVLSGELAAPPNLGAMRNLPPLNAPAKKKIGETCTRSSECASNSCVSQKCVASVGARLPGGAADVAAAAQRAQAPQQQPPQPGNVLPGGIAAPAGIPGVQAGGQQQAQVQAPARAPSPLGGDGLAQGAQRLAQQAAASAPAAPPVPPPAQPAVAYKAMLGQPFLPASVVAYLRGRTIEKAAPTCTGADCSVVTYACDSLGLVQKAVAPCATTCTEGVCQQAPGAPVPEARCSETDSGSSPAQKGTTEGTLNDELARQNGARVGTKTDVCIFQNPLAASDRREVPECDGTGCGLVEYYCQNLQVQYKKVALAQTETCADGALVQKQAPATTPTTPMSALGSNSQPCRADGTCDAGLSCLDNFCILVPEGISQPSPETQPPVEGALACVDTGKLFDYIKQWRADKKRPECKEAGAVCIDTSKLFDYIKQWRADKKRDECKK